MRPQTRQQSGIVSRHRAEVAGRDLLQSLDHPASTTFLLRTECGPSVGDGGDNEWDALFKAADEALYLSKRSGRNRTTAWAASMAEGPTPPRLGGKGKAKGGPPTGRGPRGATAA